MKKILLFVVSLWMTVALSAQDYFGRQMYVIQNGCVTFSAPVEKVDTIKFVVEDDMTSYGHEYVDLGLSVMWATCNVGASTPEEYGDYFAWGETKTKTHYDWSTYKWCNGSSTLLTKYCEDSSYGTVDSKIALDKIDDAATVYWGGDWRMPTTEEFEELTMNCTFLWTTQNGVNGCKVTSNINGNSIFLPAAGMYIGSKYHPGETGDYWQSTLHPTISTYIYTLGFTPEKTYVAAGTRCYGRPIRAVYVSKLLPTMTTAIATQITENSAVTGGNVTNDGNATVTERGVVYSTSNNPTTADGVVANGTGMGAYVCNLTGLQENTTYYARAYAINEKGTNYGEEISFTTKLILLPTLTTTAVSQIIENTAVAGGNVTSDGNATVTDRGVVYSTSQNPTVSNDKVSCGSGTGAFTCALTGLQYNTTYYVRAYATNKKGTAYGEEMVFTTDKQILLPTVTTTNAMQITETSAIAGGDVTSDGNADVTERGVVYSISSNPTTSSSKIICGSGTGAYSCTLTGLKKNTTYYVRAYAINSKGTSYGSQVSFATQAYEYVDLGLSVRWATCNVGASTPEEYGDYFAWGETQPKTAYDWTTYIWCNGSYNRLTKYNDNSDFGTVDGKTTLDKEDDAAAVNWGENWRMPTYEELDELQTNCTWTFSTQNGVLGAKVTSNINGNTIFIPLSGWYEGGELINGGSRALLWSNAIDFVTPYGVSALGFGGAEGYGGFLTISVQGRSHGRTVRAVYAGVASPSVNTADVTQITTNSAVVGGEVTNDGNATVTDRGVVYSTSQNPTVSNYKVSCGSGTGAYSCTLTGLQPNTTYYARAYAINNEGTSYGLQVTFTTDKQISLPTVTTTTATQITESTAVMGGNVTSDGNATVTERGVVYSTYSNPTTSNSKIICGSGTGAYSCTLTGLQPNTTYYARAYAINSKGTSYGSQVTFKTGTSSNTENGYEYIDLGLSVKWATMNVGASIPEGYGNYFSWGEVSQKSEYTWATYYYCNGSYTNLTKYNTDSDYGFVDNKTVLELSNDVAYREWGGNWRMPTAAEVEELLLQCTWERTTQNGVNGCKVTSNINGNSIFLPAAGNRYQSSSNKQGIVGYYWSSSLDTETPYNAHFLSFNNEMEVNISQIPRTYGFAIRPVCQ